MSGNDPPSDPSSVPPEVYQAMWFAYGADISTEGGVRPLGDGSSTDYPLRLQAEGNKSILITAQDPANGGTGAGNITWQDASQNFIATLTGHKETNGDPDVSEFSVYGSAYDVGENSEQAKILDLGIGSAKYGVNGFAHTRELVIENPRRDDIGPNGVGGEVRLDIKPGENNSGVAQNGEIRFYEPVTEDNAWAFYYDHQAGGYIKILHRSTGARPLWAHPDGWRKPTFPRGTDGLQDGVNLSNLTDDDRDTTVTMNDGEYITVVDQEVPCSDIMVRVKGVSDDKQILATDFSGENGIYDSATIHAGIGDQTVYLSLPNDEKRSVLQNKTNSGLADPSIEMAEIEVR